jgi:hypothetical protein
MSGGNLWLSSFHRFLFVEVLGISYNFVHN